MRILYLSIVAAVASVLHADAQDRSPRGIAKCVADKLVSDTKFGFVLQQERANQDGSYALMFGDDQETNTPSTYAARTVLSCTPGGNKQVQAILGLSFSAGTIEVRINGESVLRKSSQVGATLKHVDYGLFRYQTYSPIALREGDNDLVLLIRSSGKKAKVFLGVLNPLTGLQHETVTLRPLARSPETSLHPFMILGPLDLCEETKIWGTSMSGAPIHSFRSVSGTELHWEFHPLRQVQTLPGSLALEDWRYFTGTFLDALIAVSDAFSDLNYTSFVDRHIEFFLDNVQTMAREREAYALREGPFSHYFRFSLLDDVGMQVVPLLERIRQQVDRAPQLIAGTSRKVNLSNRAVDHVMKRSVRLEDGTFARYVPDTLTVWADDLFMGGVLLARAATLWQNESYLDEAVKQVVQFDDYLRDERSGLYWHGWFSRKRNHSSSKWARANGWTMMAKLEILKALSESHAGHRKVQEIFRRHAIALKTVQSTDGRWHQVLDNPATYLETSSSAMFVRAFAVGVMQGWLDRQEFDAAIRRGWRSLTSQVGTDGSVTGIVPGTPIMFSDEEYDRHRPRKNDPRGIGAVLYAAAAMQKYFELYGE